MQSQISEAVKGANVPDEIKQMQEELNKLRAESKSLKQRLKQETDAKKQWQEISRKREEDLMSFK
jgi:Skp family chaperone for outer membrane proteins